MNKQTADLEKIRTKIDKIDFTLISLVGKRFELSEKIALIKQKNGISVRNAKREKNALTDRVSWAQKEGVDKKFINRLFKVIFSQSVTIQNRVILSLKCFDRKTKK